MIIDSHTHFYDPTRPLGVPWPQKGSPLYRTVLPADFQRVATPLGVTATVVVEASPLLEDNQWILDLAETDESIVGFIGNLDLHDGAFRANLARFSANPKYRGIRARGFEIDELLEGPAFANLEHLASTGLVVELMVKPTTLAQAVEFARRLPGLTIIIDHLFISYEALPPCPQGIE